MAPELESLIENLIERGRVEAVVGVPEGLEAGLATLAFADQLRRAADRLCQEAAATGRRSGASWRQIGEAVGGITPQGAEHRFSRAAKERRSKASKVVWAAKERRVAPR
jgi:hypothetical protein